ncbi:YeeE/YedE thiosulfate transporter family protein [Devosia rhodophyticola]|uniref:YeeE/YedE thiosulfate transporter family protein n=1 Tax=Devosia rhodophyticola TaxID=3026423 RepID=A0ABY7YWQ0_9HYPH|nr:YeeE/YedE thiosulfate transporter family protein [Devosia rhodophyticola]WDR05265.1 YeeE/YedE thiosulfate transporter family protein [Devosia rhodophyticola]
MITDFTPWQALLGGVLIGGAAVALMAIHGRIAGMTGIVSGALSTAGSDKNWRLAFLVGAIAAPLLFINLPGQSLQFASDSPLWAVLFSGAVVGIGVSFAGGCTSGHGVCGNARLSPRSITATVVFMAATFATVFVVRHVLGGF